MVAVVIEESGILAIKSIRLGWPTTGIFFAILTLQPDAVF
jgi:hypothetical protein